MFKSFARSIKSIAKGPRAVLAESIAGVLSEHFVLDPADIRSSLLKDARIVLTNTQLRPKRYRSDALPGTVVSVRGVVEEVVFSWRWALKGSSSGGGGGGGGGAKGGAGESPYASGGGVVQDVVLTIRGIQVHIGLDAWDGVEVLDDPSGVHESKVDSPEDRTSVREKEGFVRKYVQQIVDHLFLRFEDFEFVVQAGSGPSVVITGKDLELGTLAKTQVATSDDNDNNSTTTTTTTTKRKSVQSILSQKISIGSFFVNVRDGASGEVLPLIEPFGYAASVVRLSGERFRGGILSGLEVTGLPEESHQALNGKNKSRIEEGILFHMGLPQIQALSAIGMMLAPANSSGEESASLTESARRNGSQSTISEVPDIDEASDSTKFHLPLPALTIVLPPSEPDHIPTKITLPSAVVSYHADGTRFEIEGREGIQDNGTPLVKLADGGKWSVDFVKKVFDLDKDGGGCRLSISDKAFTRISSSVAALSSVHDIANLKEAWESTDHASTNRAEEAASESWSISTSRLTLHLSRGSNQWLEANVAHSFAELAPEMHSLTQFNTGECTVRSSFDAVTAIKIPSSELRSGTLQISEPVEASVGSAEEALRIREFLFSFLQPFGPPKEIERQGNGIEKRSEEPNTVPLAAAVAVTDTDDSLTPVVAAHRLHDDDLADGGHDVAQRTVAATREVSVHPNTSAHDLPFAIQVHQVKVVVRQPGMNIDLKNLRGEGTSFACEAASYTADKLKIESKNIQLNCNSKSDVQIKIGAISPFAIPGVITLDEPINNISMLYSSEGLVVSTDKVSSTFQWPQNKPTNNASNYSSFNIPFPIQLDLKFLIMKDANTGILFGIKQIFMSAHQSGSTITLSSCEGARMRLQKSSDMFLDATMGKFSLQLQEVDGVLKPSSIKLSGATLGPCSPSCGKLSVTIPTVCQEGGGKISFQDSIGVSLDSMGVFENLRPLFGHTSQSQGDTFGGFPFPVEIPGMQVSVSEPPSKVQFDSISMTDSYAFCGKVQASIQNTLNFSMVALKADIMSRSLDVNCVESFTVPGTVALTEQCLNLGVHFDGGVLHIKASTPIHARVLSRNSGIVQSQGDRRQENKANIPFPIKLRTAEVNLKTLRKGDESCVNIEEIALDVSPMLVASQDLLSDVEKAGANISLEMQNISHQLFQAGKVQASLMLELEELETVHQLQVALHSPRITAGFSTIDWSSLLNETGPNDTVQQQKALKMPFAKIAGTSISISYKSTVVGSKSTIALPEFKGDSFTTSDDLSSHYKKEVLQRIPGFLTNLEILGTDITEGAFSTIGYVATGAKSLTGSGVSSVVGVALADGVKGAINAGKAARNVSTDEGYKFGDITRGIVRGMGQAAKRGARSRGSDGSEYVPGDFSVGAAQSIGEYGNKNSRKLASAGASGVGATIGLAVAGPLGFVAGSYLGGKVVGKEKESATTKYQQQNAPKQQFNTSQNSQVEDQARLQQQQEYNARLQQQQEYNARLQQQQQNLYQHQQQTSNMNSLRGNQGDLISNQYQHYQQQPQSGQQHLYRSDNQRTNSSGVVNCDSRQSYQQPQPQYQSQQCQIPFHPQSQPPQQQRESYRFGDLTRGVIAKGKQADGRSKDSGYKFGDFTRGLFK